MSAASIDFSSNGGGGAAMFLPPATATAGTILCPTCGVLITPNPSNTCSRCLRARIDLTADIPTRLPLIRCPDCSSYQQPPRRWLRADPESSLLLSLLLARVKKHLSNLGLALVGAEFVWTEPHSKRIKVKIRVEGKISGVVAAQSHVVEFVVQDRLCDSCSKASANPDQWVAKVQLRQRVPHRRTFFHLEQLIIKHNAAKNAVRFQEMAKGLDFMFANRSHAVSFVQFVSAVVPVEIAPPDTSLVSHDTKNNKYNHHHTFSVQICPICREDLICLPRDVWNALGNLGPLVICTKVTSRLMLLDPFTLRSASLDSDKYRRAPFDALMTSRQLVEYVVLHVELEGGITDAVNGSMYCSALVQVARVSDLGKNDVVFMARTHLGHLFDSGDYALGYHLHGANWNNAEINKYKGLVIPDVVLIKKIYDDKSEINSEDKSSRSSRDLEENPESSDMASTVGGRDVPSVPLEKQLDDLHLGDDGEENHADDMIVD